MDRRLLTNEDREELGSVLRALGVAGSSMLPKSLPKGVTNEEYAASRAKRGRRSVSTKGLPEGMTFFDLRVNGVLSPLRGKLLVPETGGRLKLVLDWDKPFGNPRPLAKWTIQLYLMLRSVLPADATEETVRNAALSVVEDAVRRCDSARAIFRFAPLAELRRLDEPAQVAWAVKRLPSDEILAMSLAPCALFDGMASTPLAAANDFDRFLALLADAHLWAPFNGWAIPSADRTLHNLLRREFSLGGVLGAKSAGALVSRTTRIARLTADFEGCLYSRGIDFIVARDWLRENPDKFVTVRHRALDGGTRLQLLAVNAGALTDWLDGGGTSVGFLGVMRGAVPVPGSIGKHRRQ